MERRTWDLEAYENRAKQRQKELDERERFLVQPGKPRLNYVVDSAPGTNDAVEDKEEFRPALSGSIGPEGSDRAYLKARKGKVADIDSRVGRIEMVTAESAATTKSITGIDDPKQGVVKTGVGWHCRVCDCFLKDSHTYLDHINGRKHQRKLGYSMRVERSTKDDLVAKLQSLAKKKDEELLEQEFDSEINFVNLVKAKDKELEKRREERKKRRKERKAELSVEECKVPINGATPDQPPSDAAAAKEEKIPSPNDKIEPGGDGEEDEDDEEEPQIDPALVAMMGFSGFGSSTKN